MKQQLLPFTKDPRVLAEERWMALNWAFQRETDLASTSLMAHQKDQWIDLGMAQRGGMEHLMGLLTVLLLVEKMWLEPSLTFYLGTD